MAGRAKLINSSKVAEGAVAGSHPCFEKGYSGTYKYAGSEYTIKPAEEPAHFKKCVEVAVSALDLGKTCGAPQVCEGG